MEPRTAEPETVGDDRTAEQLAGEVVARAVASLQAVDEALARLFEGTYGTCAACGAPIGSGELAEDPVATMCGSCAGAGAPGRACTDAAGAPEGS